MKTLKQISLEQAKREDDLEDKNRTVYMRLYKRLTSIKKKNPDFAKKIGRDWILDTTEELMILDDNLFKEGYAGQKLAYSVKNSDLERLEISPKSHPRAFKLLRDLVKADSTRDARYLIETYFEEKDETLEITDFEREEIVAIEASLKLLNNKKLVETFKELYRKYFN